MILDRLGRNECHCKNSSHPTKVISSTGNFVQKLIKVPAMITWLKFYEVPCTHPYYWFHFPTCPWFQPHACSSKMKWFGRLLESCYSQLFCNLWKIWNSQKIGPWLVNRSLWKKESSSLFFHSRDTSDFFVFGRFLIGYFFRDFFLIKKNQKK